MNSLLGPRYVDSDVSLRKLFTTSREQNLELRFEFFNIFNHPNLQAPVTKEAPAASDKSKPRGTHVLFSLQASTPSRQLERT